MKFSAFRLVDAITLVIAAALFWPAGVALIFPGIPLSEAAYWVSLAGGLAGLGLLVKYPERAMLVLAAWLPFSDLSSGLEVPFFAQILPLVLGGGLAIRAFWGGSRPGGRIAWIFLTGAGWMLFCALLSDRPGHSILSAMGWIAPFAGFFFHFQSPEFADRGARKIFMEKIWMAAAASGLVLLVYAFWWSPFPGKAGIRPFFLNSNFFAAYLCLLLPGLVWVARRSGKGSAKRFLAGMMAVILVVALVVLRSRGAWIGMGGGVLLALFFWLDNWLQRSLLLVVGLGMAFVFAGVMRQYLDERPALPGDVKYVLSAGDLQADFSNRERLMRWTTAWRMGLDRPIAGHGPGNFAPKFKHYLKTDAEVRQISYWFGWTGGAHSVWFTAFAETGAVGLLLLLGLLGAFLWRNGNTTRRGVWPAKAFADAQTRGFSGTNDIIPTPIQGPSKAAIVAIGFWAVAGIFNDLMLLAPLAGMLGMWFVPNGEDKVADADPSSDI